MGRLQSNEAAGEHSRHLLLLAAAFVCGCAEGNTPPPLDGHLDNTSVFVEAGPVCEAGCGPGTMCHAGGCLCDPKSCVGCCSTDGSACLDGMTDTACGQYGQTCVDCTVNSGSCMKGSCASCTPDCSGKCPGDEDGCGGTCSTNQCPGCCDGTTCNQGDQDALCGTAGGSCQDCTAGSVECGKGICVAGACSGAALPDKTPCNSGLCYGGSCCTGCWDGSGCQPGSSSDKCGSEGTPCKTCEDNFSCTLDSCESGACTSAPAAKGTPCTGGTCNEGQCCTGCWDGATCRGGISNSYCGQAGVDCSPCTTSDPCKLANCQSGSCQLPPIQDTTPCGGGLCYGGTCCTGCVSSGTCLPGTATNACGTAAAPCIACATDKVCEAGKCAYPSSSHDGCSSVAAKGCGGCACESCVCAQDPYCCNTKWDSICADECKQCNTQNGCAASPVSCPGCGGCACESCVCAMDSFCCNNMWDSICAGECQNDCGGCP